MQNKPFDFRSRLTASGVHLLISVVLAMLAGALVFALWFPWPYRIISGGQELFLLLMSVDVVIGPLLTFVVFDKTKGWRHLGRDLAIIGALQLSALAYGLYTVHSARPVALVFEVDQFRVITAADVHAPELPKARPEYRNLPLTGPRLLGTRPAHEGKERNEAMFMGLSGIDVAQRPIFWQPYGESRAAALAKSRPIELLFQHYPTRKTELDSVLQKLQLPTSEARFLPVVARKDWVVILTSTGDVSGFAAFDGFF